MLHKEILSENQLALLPLVHKFGKEFYLVGGTAIALYLGHRRSIDFDLLKKSILRRKKILETIATSGFPYQLTYNVSEQMNFIVSDVKMTFFQYEFSITAVTDFERVIKLPSLLDLAAMKAYALGRRSKWKDYVDLYFVMNKGYYSLEQISERAAAIFGELFSEKMFRVQLAYFDDVDYSEEVEYLVDTPPTDHDIKKYLEEVSGEIL